MLLRAHPWFGSIDRPAVGDSIYMQDAMFDFLARKLCLSLNMDKKKDYGFEAFVRHNVLPTTELHTKIFFDDMILKKIAGSKKKYKLREVY